MTRIFPFVTVKTIIGCVIVSSFISYGTCALYLTAKANSARIFQQEKTQQYDRPRMNNADRSLALQ